MLQRINTVLSGLPMTMVSAVFLAASFVLPRAGGTLPVDPAWVTVVICGIPLLYLAVLADHPQSRHQQDLLCPAHRHRHVSPPSVLGTLFAAGEVAFIMALGALLEEATTNRAKKGLKKLIGLAPAQGRRIRNGKER